MKILMTLMGLDIGGAETHVTELAKELTRQGHQVVVASNGGVYVPELEESGVRHVTVPMNQRSLPRMLRSLGLLRKTIQQEKPDLVHAHARIPAFLCGILQKRMGFPLLTTAHGMFEVTPILKRISNWGDRTVAVSQDLKTYLMENYQVPADQIHVTINGISTDRFRPGGAAGDLREQLGLGPGPVVMLVSRLDPHSSYNARCLMEVTPKLLETHPDTEVVIVGGGGQESVLRRQAEEVNRRCGRTAVHLTGSRTDVDRLLSLATVFVGVSRAAMEAMSEAKPVILAGNPDYDQGYQGIFTPEKLDAARESNFCCRGCGPLTQEALLADLTTVLSMDGGRRQALGDFGRQVILEEYSVARMTRDYLEAYDKLLHPPKVVRAVISGYYGYGNLGDDAILKAIAGQLAALGHPVRLTVLSRRPEKTRTEYGLPAVGRFSPLGLLGALRKSDLLISGGGSLLQDKTSNRSLWYYLSVIRLAQLMKKPVFLYANGIGPIQRPRNRRAVARCIQRCDGVTLRDQDSLAELKALGVTRTDIHVTADPAFTLTPADHGREILTALGIPPEKKILGVSVRRVRDMDGTVEQFARLCDRLSRERDLAILFLAMQDQRDEQVSRQIMDRMTQPAWLLQTPADPESMLGAIGCMDALVSMRLHTIIFAASQRIPAVGCVYDPKVAAFLKLFHMPSCGTPEEMRADEAYEVVTALLERRQTHVRELDACVSVLERAARETPALLEKLLKQKHIIG